MKKLLTIFLCIILMLTMIPTAAFAADNNLTMSGSGIESDPYLVYSEEDLVAAVQAGGWITLQENIALTQVIKIAKENTVKLDLNGKTLAGQLEITGHLMVEDTDMNGMIANSEKNVTVTVKQYGTLTLNSGIIENTANNGNAVKLEYRGDITFTMNGGSVSSEKGIPLNAMMGTVVIHGGEMISGNDSDTIKNSYGDADITVGGGDNPVYIAKLNQGSGGKLILHEGSIIGQLSGTGLSEDSILDGLFETDVSSLLPDGLTCQEIRVQEKTYYEVVSLPAEDAVAQIGEKLYFNVAKAASSIKSGETLTLLKDYIAEVPLELRQYGVTIDLNGYNITNTSGKNNDNGVGLLFYPRYGSSYPSAPTVTVKNSKASGGNISAYLPLKVRSGDSSKELPVAMEGNVTLTCIDGGDVRIVLGSATYAKYSEEMVSAIANGGFKAEVGTNDVRIYGTYASAAAVDKDGTVELLNDYIGSESITTGPTKGTLDMQNHTFTTSNKKIIDVNYDDADLTIKNGKLIGAEGKTTIGAEMLYENTKLTLENVTIDLTSEEGHGIACNGSTSNNTTIVLKNSELNIPNGLGIYFPCSGRCV